MKYLKHNGDFIEEILKLNKLTREDLDVSSFIIDKSQKPLVEFKELLLSLKDEKFLIIGDYDCDGICATTIIKRLFEHLNIKHNYYIPSRCKEGYGLNEDMVKMAKDNGFKVIFTVDNGVVATEAIKLAKENDIKTLILDHHMYSDKPLSDGLLHPSLLSKPYENISAGALSYLFSTLFYDDDYSLILGGIATLGDLMGVLDFNRYLIKNTVRLLNTGNFYQINLLNDSKSYDYDSLSFNVIPKINAINRMEANPNMLVKYLLADERTCNESINSINEVNNLRKQKSNDLTLLAKANLHDQKINVVILENEMEGLCGLVANKLVSDYGKPCIVFTEKEGILKGSGRSVDGFDLYEFLSKVKDLFLTFGGHRQAIGLSLDVSNKDKLLEYINSSDIVFEEEIKDVVEVDINSLTYDDYLKLEGLKPFGVDFKEPLFISENVSYKSKYLIKDKYPKYYFNDTVSAISFNTNDNKEFKDIVFYLRKDNYKKGNLSLLIEDLI